MPLAPRSLIVTEANNASTLTKESSEMKLWESIDEKTALYLNEAKFIDSNGNQTKQTFEVILYINGVSQESFTFTATSGAA